MKIVDNIIVDNIIDAIQYASVKEELDIYGLMEKFLNDIVKEHLNKEILKDKGGRDDYLASLSAIETILFAKMSMKKEYIKENDIQQIIKTYKYLAKKLEEYHEIVFEGGKDE